MSPCVTAEPTLQSPQVNKPIWKQVLEEDALSPEWWWQWGREAETRCEDHTFMAV